jgi:hypothetical protein
MEEYRRLQLAQSLEVSGLYGAAEETPVVTTTDLDSFLAGVYRYYTEGGLKATISRAILNVVASWFTFTLSYVLLLLVNWDNVLACTSDQTCAGLSLFYESIFPLTLYRFVVLLQLIPLGVYTVVLSSLACIARVREAVRISIFFRDALFVAHDEELHFLSWSEIVARISRYQSTAATPLCIVQDSLSPLEIQNIILRLDNIQMHVMKKWFSDMVVKNDRLWMSVPLQSRAIQWCIQHGVISWLLDDRYRVRSEALSTVRSRIILVGIVSLLLMGPLAIFAAFLLVILESDEFRANRASLFEKEWTVLSRSVLRHGSEPEISLSQRLEKGREKACNFSNPLILNKAKKSFLRTVKFLAAGILAALAAIALVQDSALMHMTLVGKSLLFFFAVFSGVMALSAGLDTPVPKTSVGEKLRSGLGVTAHAHSDLSCGYTESTLFRSACEELTKARELDHISSDFSKFFFRPKIVNLLNELVGIILLPVFFLVVFPDTLSVMITEVPLIRHDRLGDFASSGLLEARAISEQSQEMVDVVSGGIMFSSLRDSETVGSLLTFFSSYQGIPSGLSEQQENTVLKVLEFKKYCLKSEKFSEKSDWFWYSVLRELTMSEGKLSLVRMSDDLVRLGLDSLRTFSKNTDGSAAGA